MMIISIANSKTSKYWKPTEITWEQFLDRVSHTIRTAETVEEYRKLTKATQDEIKNVGGFVAGKLKDGKRKSGCVEYRSMLTLDMDYAKPDMWETLELLYDFTCCIYSTHKHTPEKPRLRLVIPLSRNVSEEEYCAISRMAAKDIGIEQFDDTTYEPTRLMYWPSTSSDGEFIFKKMDGVLLDPDKLLERYTDWKNTDEWPVSSRHKSKIRQSMSKQTDPLEKEGLIGAFCRAYTVQDAIEKFIPDVYEPSALDGRYDYIPADSSAGVIVYDDKFAYSHHATDPACGKLCNAFDIVRIHKFGELDSEINEETAVSRMPSFKAMQKLCVSDDGVKYQLAEERQASAENDFTSENWQQQLDIDRKGNVINSLKNLLLILQNDENLTGIAFNQLSDGMEKKTKVPWNSPNKWWRDADDAQLISYIDGKYGTFSARNYAIAVTKVTDDRSYHPIREFLYSLPEWDGVERLDTLLIDYLGAKDDKYIRAVTRKTFCAAVARVLNSGCKYDTMLVLNGAQGIGKSTLISKLGQEWYSDSLQLSDTHDKTAAEKLQGYWILEIGELAGFNKADVETLRSFLSRQNDIYRASFAKRPTPHPRQCVFIGTSNSEQGYLRDTTGNRRFWPVKVNGNGTKKPWQLTVDEIHQIWAETLLKYKNGESLFLDDEINEIAVIEQRKAMESDDREGLVREYLDTLLPEDWNTRDLYSRRMFLNGSEFDNQEKGTVQRLKVCPQEIWAECFNKNPSDLKNRDSAEINAIMVKIEGWEKIKTPRKFSFYGSCRGFEKHLQK